MHLKFCVQTIWKLLFREPHMITKIYSSSTPNLLTSPSASKCGVTSIAIVI